MHPIPPPPPLTKRCKLQQKTGTESANASHAQDERFFFSRLLLFFFFKLQSTSAFPALFSSGPLVAFDAGAHAAPLHLLLTFKGKRPEAIGMLICGQG